MNWDAISPTEFEELIAFVLEALGYQDIHRVGGSNDRGEDIVVRLPVPAPGFELQQQKWVIQCKKTAKLGKANLLEDLAKVSGSGLDVWVLVTIVQPTPEERRWFEQQASNRQHDFEINVWWREDVERYVRASSGFLHRHAAHLATKLGVEDTADPGETLDYEGIVRSFREAALRQIETFARTKYIPELYVPRELEAEVEDFIAGPVELARTSRLRIEEALRTALLAMRSRFAVEKERLQLALGEAEAIRDYNEKSPLLPPSMRGLRTTTANAEAKKATERAEKLQGIINRLAPLEKDVESEFARLNERLAALPGQDFAELRSAFRQLRLDLGRSGPLVRDQFQSMLEVLARASGGERPADGKPFPHPDDAAVLKEVTGSFHHAVSQADRLLRHAIAIVDRAGGGKTNLLCCLVERTSSTDPVVLLFGRDPRLGTQDLVAQVTARVADLLRLPPDRAIDALDALLEARGRSLLLFIDAINETRDIDQLSHALSGLLEWSAEHHVRIVLTCRDIYWGFFHQDLWDRWLFRIHRQQLAAFSEDEYGKALRTYLRHYRIRCELTGAAYQACTYPLLLRFFCEAYGQIGGPETDLGTVRDIRLKALFDVYLQRKGDQIRRSMGHLNADAVDQYLGSVTSYMFAREKSAISLAEVSRATGLEDTSSRESLYLRLLDEDIIIEEQPGHSARKRRVSFVYEAFMEYVLARALLANPAYPDPCQLFRALGELVDRWTNARGVAEFVGMMLLDGDLDSEPSSILDFLHCMSRDVRWKQIYWALVGRCPPELASTLHDDFHRMICAESIPYVADALRLVSHHSAGGASNLAVLALWSASLPPVIPWSALPGFEKSDTSALETLGASLAARIASGERVDAPATRARGRLLTAAFPWLDHPVAEAITDKARVNQVQIAPAMNDMDAVLCMWAAPCECQPLLINGLFDPSERIRAICADRIRFASCYRNEIATVLAPSASAEPDPRIRCLLEETVRVLRATPATGDAGASILVDFSRGVKPRPAPRKTCPGCAADDHASDARFCRRCGSAL